MSDATPVTSVGGLRGQSAGSTAICTVGKEAIGLTYRGYHIEDLARVTGWAAHVWRSAPTTN